MPLLADMKIEQNVGRNEKTSSSDICFVEAKV